MQPLTKIIQILDIQKPKSYDSFTEVYLIQVTPVSDLSNSRNSWKPICIVLSGLKISLMTTANTSSTRPSAP